MLHKPFTNDVSPLLALLAVGGVLYGGLLNVQAIEDAQEASYRSAHGCRFIVAAGHSNAGGVIFQCDNGRWTQRELRSYLADHLPPPTQRMHQAPAPAGRDGGASAGAGVKAPSAG